MSARDIHSTLCVELANPVDPVDPGNAAPRIAKLVGFDDQARPRVQIPGASTGPAQTIVKLDHRHVGESVFLQFAQGDPAQPVILGVIQAAHPTAPQPAPDRSFTIEADGERLLVEAEQQIVLRCGKASITLTRAGKVLIRGAYVSSSSSGMVRVSGATVRLN